jgi:CO/xanthine dehydrogenase Mo-binding subunit
METTVVGTRVARLDAPGKVTGQASYVADLHLSGMVYAKLLLSKHAHARIISLDTTRARAHPGVVEIITWKDVPSDYYGELVFDQKLFAKEKVKFSGDAIALVAGETTKAAQEAVNLIEVEYEPLPALLDAGEALKPDAQQVHEEYASFKAIPPLAGMFEEIKGLGIKNLAWQSQLSKGDVNAGFAQADKVLEETYSTDMGQAVPLEPRAVVAAPDVAGKVTIWTTTQVPFGIRSSTVQALKLPMTKIRVIAPAVGGGFGSKCQIGFEPHVAALALKIGRPVKLVLERAEDQATANPRHPATICIKSGVKNDGTLLAREIDIVLDTGYCSSLGPVAAGFSCFLSCGPYKIPNLAVTSATVYTNKPSCSMVRAPAAPQITFAVESHTDSLAQALKMDPLAFRLKNIVDEGDYGPTDQILKSVSLRETLTRAAEKASWGSSVPPKRGVGLACGWWGTAIGRGSAATVEINEDGTVRLLTGAAEQGSGSAYGGLAQIVAEELQVPIERINVVNGDTDATPYDFGAVGSRTMFNAGHAVRMAAAEVKNKLLNMAAGMLEARVDDLVLSQGKVYVKGTPDKAVPYGMLCAIAPFTQGPLVGCGSFNMYPPGFDAGLIKRSLFNSIPAAAFFTQVAEVEVDQETGQVKVVKITAVQDVGCAINPLGVEGQIEGGILQGIGLALTERVTFENGKMANPTYLDFKIPVAPDTPQLDVTILEKKAEEGPYGAKGVGEPPIVPTAAAIANAVYNATGVRLYELPMTQERVVAALKKKGKPKGKAA